MDGKQAYIIPVFYKWLYFSVFLHIGALYITLHILHIIMFYIIKNRIIPMPSFPQFLKLCLPSLLNNCKNAHAPPPPLSLYHSYLQSKHYSTMHNKGSSLFLNHCTFSQIIHPVPKIGRGRILTRAYIPHQKCTKLLLAFYFNAIWWNEPSQILERPFEPTQTLSNSFDRESQHLVSVATISRK